MRRILAAAVAALVAATPAHAQLFDFEGGDSPLSTSTTFALTRSGVTATFLGTPDPFVVVANPGVLSTLTGNVLFDLDPTPSTLEIQFSAPQTSIGLLFGLVDPTNAAVLQMNVFDGGTLVGTVSGSGAIPAGFPFPEGALSFSGAAFDHVFLFATGANDFAIDDVRLGGAAVIPEPATVALTATGLLALGGATVRRRRPNV
jgi:hypothetical protein